MLEEHACFGGTQGFYEHASDTLGLPMRFGVYRPPQAAQGPVPVLYYLAGLTCNEQTFAIKAGAQQHAARHGLLLVTPDTSPRGTGVPGADKDWDFGHGAGFYLDAEAAPYAKHWRMESYLTAELPQVIAREFPAKEGAAGIFGHSMGGHGALTLALRHPGRFRTLSALAPICAPSRCPWGEQAFTGYLGGDRTAWIGHDATELMTEQDSPPYPGGILVDQGLEDKFLAEQLHPHLFEAACEAVGQPLTLRRHAGYDHGYYFVSTFIEDHLRFHAAGLTK